MLKTEKKEFVSELHQVYSKLDSMVVTHYHGLKVSEITNLRNSLRKSGAKLKVVKNTLSKIATNDTQLDAVASMFKGPVAVIYSEGEKDSFEAIKKIAEFNKSNDKLKIIGGILNNQLLSAKDLQTIARLPSLQELRAQFVALLQLPAVKIVNVLQVPSTSLARVVNAYATKN